MENGVLLVIVFTSAVIIFFHKYHLYFIVPIKDLTVMEATVSYPNVICVL